MTNRAILPPQSGELQEAFRGVSQEVFYGSASISPEDAMRIFSNLNASWVHDGDPKSPHAELTSGKCSNGYFNCTIPLSFPLISAYFAEALGRRIRKQYKGEVDWVIGSPMAGITFAHDVARVLGAKRSAFVEKDPDNQGKFLWKRLVIPEGDKVLQIEELTTTALTLCGVREAIDEQNEYPVDWIDIVGILVHRPSELPVGSYDDRRIVPLIEQEVWAVPQDECPLCAGGSKRYRPKQHWAELTSKK